MDTHFSQALVYFPARSWFDGGIIHKNQTRMGAGKDAVISEYHLEDIRRVGQIGEHDVGTLSNFPRTFRCARALAYQFFYFLPRAIVHDQWETGLEQILRHRFSHQTQTNISQT